MSLRCVILDGSVRQTRQGIKAARFVVEQLARRGHTTTLVDPLERPLPLLDRMYKEYPKARRRRSLKRWPRPTAERTLLSLSAASTTMVSRRP